MQKGAIIVGFLLLIFGCATSMTPPLTAPNLTQRPRVVRVDGFATSGKIIERTVSSRLLNNFELVKVKMPYGQSKFIDYLENNKTADFFVTTGEADYVVNGTKVVSDDGSHFFGFFLMYLFTIREEATSEVEARIYSRDGRLVNTVNEKGSLIYRIGIIGLLKNRNIEKRNEIRDRTLQRISVRTAEAIQRDMQRTQAIVP